LIKKWLINIVSYRLNQQTSQEKITSKYERATNSLDVKSSSQEAKK